MQQLHRLSLGGHGHQSIAQDGHAGFGDGLPVAAKPAAHRAAAAFAPVAIAGTADNFHAANQPIARHIPLPRFQPGPQRSINGKGRLNFCPIAAGADRSGRDAPAQHCLDRVENNRLARARFSRQHIQPGPKGHFQRIHQRKVFNPQ